MAHPEAIAQGCAMFLLRGLTARAGGDVLHLFVLLHLLSDVVFEQVAGYVHQGIPVVGVLAHASQAGVVVVEHACLLLGIIG